MLLCFNSSFTGTNSFRQLVNAFVKDYRAEWSGDFIMKMFYSLTVGKGTNGSESWVHNGWNWV